MLDRNLAGVLSKIRKNLHKHRLHQIFIAGAPGQMSPDQLQDQRIEPLGKNASGVLVALSQTPHAGRHIESVLSHSGPATKIETVEAGNGYDGTVFVESAIIELCLRIEG